MSAIKNFEYQLNSYESGEMDFDESLSLFQYIYETEAYKWLQSSYYYTLQVLIQEGYIATFDESDFGYYSHS